MTSCFTPVTAIPRCAAAECAAFLEAEAAKPKTPEARTVFDSHRLSPTSSWASRSA